MPTVIKAADSMFGTGIQFQGTATVADKFTLDADAFLVSSDSLAIILSGPAAWTATINGQVLSKSTVTDSNNQGLFFAGSAGAKLVIGAEGSVGSENGVGIVSLGGASSLAITNNGDISGVTAVGLFGSTAPNSVTNKGTIISHKNVDGDRGAAIAFSNANDTVTNSGLIDGDIEFGNGNNKLVNSGGILTAPTASLTIGVIRFGNGADTVENSAKGFLGSNVELGGGSNAFKNAGFIGSEAGFVLAGPDIVIVGGAGADTFNNAKTGSIFGGVQGGDGANTFTNAGHVDSTTFNASGFSYLGGEETDVVVNSKGGTFRARVELGGGTNSLKNAGSIGLEAEHLQAYIVLGGSGVDTINNTGKIFGGVTLFGGNDIFTNTGTVTNFIDMGIGDDKFFGSKSLDAVVDDVGADFYNLGASNDYFQAYGGENPDSLDTVDGGAGDDLYVAAENTALFINLDTVAHQSAGFVLPAKNLLANQNQTSLGTDIVKNFERAHGAGLADIIMGSAAVNSLDGGGGDDELWGFGGNDYLSGGGEDDYLVGGAGADSLSGDTGADRFVFKALSDSGITRSTRDIIQDFEDGIDKIDLSAMDANTKTSAIDDFTLLHGSGTSFNFLPGGGQQLKILETATGYRILGEVNGDGKADFSIDVKDLDHSTVWSLNDFIL